VVPDGKLIAFVRQQVPSLKGLRPGPRHLHVISPTGRTAKQLTANEAINPSWSPGGKYIAFDDGKRIGIVRRQGGPARFIATGTDPAWSPDGAKIAFVRNRSIWLVGAAGQRPRLALRNAVDPAWRVGAAHVRVRPR
jgi:Tol biopolymer transport system component